MDAVQNLSNLSMSDQTQKVVSDNVPDTSSNGNVPNRQNDIPDEEVDQLLAEYFRPVYEAFNKKCGGLRSTCDFKITPALLKNLCKITSGPDFFKGADSMNIRVHNDICWLLDVTKEQSDLDDLLMFHPSEVLSSKISQVLISIALVEPKRALMEFSELSVIIEKQKPRLDRYSQEAYEFILETLTNLLEVLTGESIVSRRRTDKAPLEFDQLHEESQGLIVGLRALFLRWFKIQPQKRFLMMKEAHSKVPTSVEWVLYLAQSLRQKRRDLLSPKISKKVTPEEMEYLELTVKMEPHNPFVRLGVIESVIDAVREFNGRLRCGNIHLVDLETAMDFLRKECESLCKDYPRNVSFISTVSDYFARFVPRLYFDKEFSEELINKAYSLNPRNPKTTHRLGILHRMLMKNIPESLRWLEKTIELDPFHFSGQLDYYKTILGKPKEFANVGQRMKDVLNSGTHSCWRPQEKYEFQFYTGLAFFATGDKEETLRLWMDVLGDCEKLFALTVRNYSFQIEAMIKYLSKILKISDVDLDCNIFKWDASCISTDKIRLWMQEEYSKVRSLKESSDSDSNLEVVRRRKAVSRMFSLMLGRNHLRPLPSIGPFSENFPHALPEKIAGLFIPTIN